MSARPAFAAGLSAAVGACICIAVLPAIEGQSWADRLATLKVVTAARWLEIATLCLFAYALAAAAMTTTIFATQQRSVSAGLRRLGARAAAYPPTVQDWNDVLRNTELEPLSNRLLALPNTRDSSPTRCPLIPMAPFNAGAARDEIRARFMRRLWTLQIWSATALLGVGSAFFLMGWSDFLQTAHPIAPVWISACATLSLILLLAAAIASIAERADAVATTISRLPLASLNPEPAGTVPPGHMVARRDQDLMTAGALSSEIVALRLKLVDVLERQHQDMVAAMRHGLRDGLYPLSQGMMKLGADLAETDREHISAAIRTAFDSLMDRIEERTAAPLVEAKRLLEATSRAVTSLSRAVARMRQDGAGHERAQNERVAILAEGLLAPKPDQVAGLFEQFQSTNQTMAEAHRTAVTEMGLAVKAEIEHLAEVTAQAQQEMTAHQQALHQEIEKLAGTVDALSARLVPGLRRLSAVDQRVGTALDRHDSIAARSQALMEELAGLLEGVRSSLERVVDAAANAGHRNMSVPIPPRTEESVAPDTPSLRDELEALRGELETAQRDVSLDPVAGPNQPPS